TFIFMTLSPLASSWSRCHERVSCRCFTSDLGSVSVGVKTNRVRKNRWCIWSRVDNVIDQRTARRVETCQVAHALSDLVIGARRVATDAQSANDLAIAIQRHSAAEED